MALKKQNFSIENQMRAITQESDNSNITETTLLLPEDLETPPHIEKHFDSADVVRDVIIGLSDGLTVPFALAAGLASLNNSRLVVTAGIAEIIAGAISMGLGGFLAGKSEIEHYDSERKREEMEVLQVPDLEEAEIYEVFEPYGVTKLECEPIIKALRRNNTVRICFNISSG